MSTPGARDVCTFRRPHPRRGPRRGVCLGTCKGSRTRMQMAPPAAQPLLARAAGRVSPLPPPPPRLSLRGDRRWWAASPWCAVRARARRSPRSTAGKYAGGLPCCCCARSSGCAFLKIAAPKKSIHLTPMVVAGRRRTHLPAPARQSRAFPMLPSASLLRSILMAPSAGRSFRLHRRQ